MSVRGSTSLGATPELSSSRSSPLTTSASLAEFPTDHSTDPSASRATISSLLDQLTELHDRQQKERVTEWDAFLAHRAKVRITAVESRKGSAEMIWGSGLVGFDELQGKKGDQEDKKTFARLVRRGIPLVYRNDIWAGEWAFSPRLFSDLTSRVESHELMLRSECSGARDTKVPGEYAEILRTHAGEPSPVQAEIEKDVTRTFPGNLFFGELRSSVILLELTQRQEAMARVCQNYGTYSLRTPGQWTSAGYLPELIFPRHNPAIGYCQGMNMLAATLLLTHSDEGELSFL